VPMKLNNELNLWQSSSEHACVVRSSVHMGGNAFNRALLIPNTVTCRFLSPIEEIDCATCPRLHCTGYRPSCSCVFSFVALSVGAGSDSWTGLARQAGLSLWQVFSARTATGHADDGVSKTVK
jgi:hypothetical protein